jgi:hypothetical protein
MEVVTMLGLWTKAKPQPEPLETAPPEPVEQVQLITFRRNYYPGNHRVAAAASVFYASGGRAHHVTARLTWEALALLRRELTRRDHWLSDDELVEQVLSRFVLEGAEARADSDRPDEEEMELDFTGGPNSSEPRQMLERAGILI